MDSPPLDTAYVAMRTHFGHQHWWPGETPLEICLGAILTQNTSWRNVELALNQLKQADCLQLPTLETISQPDLSSLIRPAGYHNVKAKRIKHFLAHIRNHLDGCLEKLFEGPLTESRNRLLEINGIGPETADCMLLYAGQRPSFVIDAYTKRIFKRHGWGPQGADYQALQILCETQLIQSPIQTQEQLDYWQDYHAQIVMVGKHFCHARSPQCQQCPLATLLPPSGVCD